MTYEELLMWESYIKKRGSLHMGMRLELGFGVLTHYVRQALGGKGKPSDFMPHYEEPEVPVDQAMREWS